MLLLNNKEIMKILTMDKAIECVKKAYSLYSADKVESPQRIALKNELSNGTALFMPATVKETGDTSVKIVSVYPENKKYKKETVLSTILLLDNKTGEVCSVLDGGSITQMRTGAASGVAIELLSKKDSKIGALLGTGGHAIGQLQAMLTANLDEIYIYSRNYENAINFINKFRPIL
ncbi:MAG TPA: ornithine cyclodeaminase family protein, partial [Peptostreptococcaceae bacterium]|nr:ornithine cyclodeaminase family protein [Peptostreptococcaceae bacterium]